VVASTKWDTILPRTCWGGLPLHEAHLENDAMAPCRRWAEQNMAAAIPFRFDSFEHWWSLPTAGGGSPSYLIYFLSQWSLDMSFSRPPDIAVLRVGCIFHYWVVLPDALAGGFFWNGLLPRQMRPYCRVMVNLVWGKTQGVATAPPPLSVNPTACDETGQESSDLLSIIALLWLLPILPCQTHSTQKYTEKRVASIISPYRKYLTTATTATQQR